MCRLVLQILTLFQTKKCTCYFPHNFSDLNSKIHTRFQDKKAKKNPILWGSTYLYGLYKEVPPPGLVHFLVSETTSLSKAVNVFYKYNGQVCGTLHGCLPFTWPDRGRFTLRADGKQKFKTGITCSIYQTTAVIKLVSKMTLKKWNTNI